MAGVQSIERAFSILRALSLGASGVTDLSERTGLPKSTVSRLLSSLEFERAVAQLDDGTYELGKGIGELASTLRPGCLLYTSPSPRDLSTSRMPSSA